MKQTGAERQPEVAQPEAPPREHGEHTTNADAPVNVRPETEKVDDTNVLLPVGEWVRAKGTPYYYSQAENLYYHPNSCQFYDPTNEMWYDPEKKEWYRDDEDDMDM